MKNTMKRIMALALILAMIIGVVPSVFAVDYVNHFTDVPTNKWYAEYVEYVNDRGWMNGIGNNLFGPDDTLERAMVATVLYRKAGSPAVAAPSTFTDVPAGKWYSNAVAWAQATGVVNGVTATEFAPSQNVLREELVTMIWRGAGEPKVAEDYLKDFPDSGSIRAYAKAAFNWAIANKIIGGANGKLLPQDNATRAEFAKIMTQFDKLENPCEAHKWDDGKVTKAATCTEAGEKTYTCTVCGKTKVVAIPALGHIDENKDNKCDRCGEKLGDTPTPPTPTTEKVVIYFAGKGKVMTTEEYTYTSATTGKSKVELVAADATLEDGKVKTAATNVAEFEMTTTNGVTTFKTADGKYLFADGTDVKLVDAEGENTKFVLEDAANGKFIRCATAEIGGKQQYLEFWGNYFTVFGMDSTKPEIYMFGLYPLATGGDTPTPPAPTGDKTFAKVTADLTNWAGTYVIGYELGDGTAVIFNGKTDTDGNIVTASVTDNKVTVSSECAIEVAAVEGGYTLKASAGYLNGKTRDDAPANGTKFETEPSTATIEWKDGNPVITSAAGTVFRYNNGLQYGSETEYCKWFRFYKANSSIQTPVVLYKLVDGETPTPPTPPTPHTPPTPPTPSGDKYVAATELKEGDQVILVCDSKNVALCGTYKGFYNNGLEVAPVDGVIENPDSTIVWTVGKEGEFYTFSYDGKKIGMGDSYTSMPLDAVNYKWQVEAAATEGCFYVKNLDRDSTKPYYMQWQESFGTWSGYHTLDEALMAIRFYVKTAGEEPQPSKDITVCFTNDVHGAYELYPYAATAMKGADLIVDAGDNIQGSVATTLTNGQCMVDLMKAVGYDVAVPGNHEFDYGFDRFLEIVNGDNTPYVSANLWDKTADKAVLDAYKIFTVGDKKVAVVGITTPETLVKSTPAFFQNEAGEYIYDFCNDTTGEKLYTVVQKAVDAAKAEGADYVIAVGHLGIDEQSEPWTSTSVIANTTGIDALIDGHSHSTFATTQKNKDGKDIPVAQTGTKLENVGKMTIAADGTITAENLPLKNSEGYLYEADAVIAAKVAEIKAEVDKVSNTVVARTEVDLTTLDPTTGKRAVRSAETNLGDLCADAYRDLLKTDVAFVNGGGVRANINKGDITYGQIIAVHPFGNTACKIEVTGEQLWTALEIGSAACPGESGGFLQVSGIEYTINTAIPTPARFNENKEFEKLEGEHRVTDVKVNGEPLDVNKTYTLGGHNYMLINGGDGYTVFRGSKILAQEVAIDNEVLIKYITGTLNGVVGADSIYANPTGAGRIKIVTSAHEHTYGDVKYTWTADGESFTCTAYKECTVSGCGDKLTATGTVTAKDDPAATCTAEGKRVFTATFTEDGFGTDTKTVDLPALGHVDEDKDNKCDRCGATLSTPVTGARYEKVTEDQKDWSGTYLIVYEASETEAYVFSGVDAHGNLVTATFTDGKIPSSDAIKACEVTVAKEGDGYSFKLNGGANAGKYLTAYSGRNKIVFSDSAKALSIKVEDGVVKVLDGTAPFQFNKTNNDNGLWFRFFGKKSGGQSEIALYKLAN